jgi:hypothetical protein
VQGVGDQQPRPGLAGHDPHTGRRPGRHAPHRQRPQRIDHLGEVVDDDRARLAQRRPGQREVAQQAAGVRARGHVDVRPPEVQRHHRQRRRQAGDGLAQRAAVVDPLDVEPDRPSARVAGEEVEHVGEAHVGGVAEADAEAQAETVLRREEAGRQVHPAAARHDRDRPGLQPGDVGDEVREHPRGRVHEAGRVRPEQADAAPPAHGQRLVLAPPPAVGLGEPARTDDRRAHPRGPAVLQRRGGGLRRHDQHGQVDGLADRRHRRQRGAALDLGRSRVDEVKGAREPRERPHHRVAGLARRRRRTHHGDRARREQAPQRVLGHPPIVHID